MKDIIILGIESSCDDTSAAVIKNGYLLSNVTAGQAVHEAYGGVVPELASRAHQQNIVPVVDQALRQAGVDKEAISAVAVTLGPGLMGSLLVGVSFAKGLAAALGVPLIEAGAHSGTFHRGGRRDAHGAALSLSLLDGQWRQLADCEGKRLQSDGDAGTDDRRRGRRGDGQML